MTAFTLCCLLTSLHLTNGKEEEEEEEDSDNSDYMTQVCPGGGLSSYNIVLVSCQQVSMLKGESQASADIYPVLLGAVQNIFH